MKKDLHDEQAWESICEQCGLCCFEKIEAESGAIFFTQTPCRYLDVETRQCKIYDRRFAINPECVKLTPELVREIRWLHDGCGYMKAFGLKNRTRAKRAPRRSMPLPTCE
jgi:uncharacterized cysteine cluster protein YcgN (CxxCxxCC family)